MTDFVSVPHEPTEAMLEAAYATNEPFLPNAVWAAMVAAAPSPEPMQADLRETIAGIISGAPFPSKRSFDKADAILSAMQAKSVPSAPNPDLAWKPMTDAPRDRTKIVVVDRWGNAETLWFDPTEYCGEARGWVAKNGCPSQFTESNWVGWTHAPHALASLK